MWVYENRGRKVTGWSLVEVTGFGIRIESEAIESVDWTLDSQVLICLKIIKEITILMQQGEPKLHVIKQQEEQIE